MSISPKVSIYATVFNNADVVKASLDSIINQLKLFSTEFEFVVVDNFSVDGTYEILQGFSRRYPNFKVLRERCSRGKGRRIAFDNTIGKYAFYVDLDAIYLPIFAKLISVSLDICGKNDVINNPSIGFGFMHRDTMERIGNWYDLNVSEDIEFFARAVDRGVHVRVIPVHASENQVLRDREDRYATGAIERMSRAIRNERDKILGNGIAKIGHIIRSKMTTKLLASLIFAGLRLVGRKAYIYSKYPNNEEYLLANIDILEPASFGIPAKYYVFGMAVNRLMQASCETCNSLFDRLSEIGFDTVRYTSKNYMIAFTGRTDKSVIEHYCAFASKTDAAIARPSGNALTDG